MSHHAPKIYEKVGVMEYDFCKEDIDAAELYHKQGLKTPQRDSSECYYTDDESEHAVVLGIDRLAGHAMVFLASRCMVASLFLQDEESLRSGSQITHYDELYSEFTCPKGLMGPKCEGPPGYRFHICFGDRDGSQYILKPKCFVDYRAEMAKRCHQMWYLGTTRLRRKGAMVQALIIYYDYEQKYELMQRDCLEFAKEFARRATGELSREEFSNLCSFFKGLAVSDGKILASSERSSRNTSSGKFIGLSYASSRGSS